MDCGLCQMPLLESDIKASTPCCENSVHVHCLIDLVANSVVHYHDALCFCGGIVHANSDNHFINNHGEPPANNLMGNAAAAADVKKIKKMIRERNKASTEFCKKVNEKHAEFLFEARTHLDIVKTVKDASVKAIQDSEEHKQYKKTLARVTFHSNRFMREYNVNNREFNRLVYRNGWPKWRSRPKYIISRKFRFRL